MSERADAEIHPVPTAPTSTPVRPSVRRHTTSRRTPTESARARPLLNPPADANVDVDVGARSIERTKFGAPIR